jgi:glycosyltransferase involved in cell wall biosynthesis
MKRIGLNIICNNDAAIIGKMLESARAIADVIVAVDLGSTDETISLIRKFGFLSNILTFVYKRPFDNFCNSRNYALEKLHEVVQELSWLPQQTWCLTLDCDERIKVGEKFSKDTLADDLYLVPASHENDYFMKRTLFRLSADFHWENPVYEVLTSEKEPIKTSSLPSLSITREHKPTPVKTWVGYAQLLSGYAEAGHQDFQTLYHLGEIYKSAGDYLAAEKYYTIAAQLDTSTSKQKALAQHHQAANKFALNENWENIQSLFLQSYNEDMQQAESIADLIRHYMAAKQWPIAHLFSSFAYDIYHNKPPELDDNGSRIEKSLYQWELLFFHSICCYHTKRTQEAKALRKTLKKYALSHMEDFSPRQLISILCSPVLFSSGKIKS